MTTRPSWPAIVDLHGSTPAISVNAGFPQDPINHVERVALSEWHACIEGFALDQLNVLDHLLDLGPAFFAWRELMYPAVVVGDTDAEVVRVERTLTSNPREEWGLVQTISTLDRHLKRPPV
jgi:hypothetical protein